MARTAQLTLVVDNEAGPGCIAEHGFALWIESGDARILLDTGQGLALAPNAQFLGLDLGRTNVLVLSHGHYDHTGAVSLVLDTAPGVHVYAHPGIAESRYSVLADQVRDIRMPRAALRSLSALPPEQMHWTIGPTRLALNLGLSGPIARQTDFEDTGGPFFLDPEGTRPDRLTDDQAVWISTSKGLVICVGCCHSGLVNTIMQVRELSGQDRVYAIVGGLHLGAASPQRLESTVLALGDIQPTLLVPCHCTGAAATAYLRERLDCQVQSGYAGLRLSLE